ncbi:MAG: 2-oxoacid:acceptor oxidoreductase family protein [Cellulomonas sp.]|nr:2-oxoacid:acceptor oxidoreductase family protein [Cellulomonas sp.]
MVTAAEMLARAGFLAGHEAQAIPSFGSERTGAPVVAYCRFDDRPIRTREPVLAPHVVLVQDPTLLVSEDPFVGLAPGGTVIVATEHPAAEVHEQAGPAADGARVLTVPALRFALEALGKPKPSAAMLGAYAAATGMVTLDSVQQVFRRRYPGALGEQNAAAAAQAFAFVAAQVAELAPQEVASRA